MASIKEPADQGIVLIADNSPAGGEYCRKLLEPEGYQIHIARSGRQALSTIRQIMPDVVLLDLMLPDMDGLQFLEQLKTDPVTGDVPVLVHAVRNENPVLQKALRMGADDFLKKPFDADELIARIKKVLNVKQTRDAFRSASEELIKSQLTITAALKKWERENDAFREQCRRIIVRLLNEAGADFIQEPASGSADQAGDLIERIFDLNRFKTHNTLH